MGSRNQACAHIWKHTGLAKVTILPINAAQKHYTAGAVSSRCMFTSGQHSYTVLGMQIAHRQDMRTIDSRLVSDEIRGQLSNSTLGQER